ncbi:MAG: hypothetical protein J6T88_00320 [Bacteroidales bacterium]|nr:hypothetical protein [Bacteroidales bacterium]
MKFKPLHSILFVALAFLLMPSVAGQTISSTDTTKVHTMRGTFYSDKFIGRKTSSGEVFTQDKFTAAHKSFKFGTLLLVTNPKNGKQVIVRINDRCPKSNILDLTRRAAQQIEVKSHTVQVEVLPPRFYAIWEIQETILDILEKGLFRELIASGNSQVSQNKGELYNLELFRCKSRDEAKKRVERLPIYYQDKVEYKQHIQSGNVIAVLEMSVNRARAELVKKELGALFPNVKIVEAN